MLKCDTHNTCSHTHYSFNHAFAKSVKGLCCVIGGGISVWGLMKLTLGMGAGEDSTLVVCLSGR